MPRKRVLEHSEREREWSEPMRNTPRKRRFEHALRGYWARFPASPGPYAKEIGSHFDTRTFYPEKASFGLSRTLDRYVDRARSSESPASRPRPRPSSGRWMTVVIELMGHADDSYGSIGMSFDDGFAAYLKIPLDEAGIDEEVFFQDLLDFLIWEDYGLTDDRIEGYFKGLTPAQADLCIEHLRRQIDELRADDLEYQSEEALTILGQVVAEQERFDLFEGLAREMGSREWQRVIRLADRAVKKRKRPLACKVFEAALTEGSHLDFLDQEVRATQGGATGARTPGSRASSTSGSARRTIHAQPLLRHPGQVQRHLAAGRLEGVLVDVRLAVLGPLEEVGDDPEARFQEFQFPGVGAAEILPRLLAEDGRDRPWDRRPRSRAAGSSPGRPG